MSKLLQTIIGIAVIIITLSIGYYFVVYLPSKGISETEEKKGFWHEECIKECEYMSELKVWKYFDRFVGKEGYPIEREFQTQEQCIKYCLIDLPTRQAEIDKWKETYGY